MSSNLPAVDSVWGVVDGVKTWRRFCGVDDDRGYHWETWRGEFFEAELRIESGAVDITAIGDQLRTAIDLLKRCYKTGHREGWQDGESNAECFGAVSDFFARLNVLGIVPALTPKQAAEQLAEQFTSGSCQQQRKSVTSEP